MSTEQIAAYKLLILGPVATNICVQFWQDYSTEELNFGSSSPAKVIEIDGNKCILELIYTTGQTDIIFPNHQEIRDADGFIIVYNVNEYSSFDKVKDFITNIQHIKDSDKVPIILAANADPKAIRVISAEKGIELAKNYDIPFFNISLKRHIVKDVVIQCVKEIRKRQVPPAQPLLKASVSNIKSLFGRKFNTTKSTDDNDDRDTLERASFLPRNPPKVEASPYSVNMPSDFEGWLTKRGGRVHSWKLRYFRLCGDTLHYFKNLEDTTVKGSITLVECKIQRADELLKKQFCFELSSKKMERHYYICAKNEKEAETWVNIITKNIVLKTPRKDKLNKLSDIRALFDRQIITEIEYYKYQEQIIKELLQETYTITHPKDDKSLTEKAALSAPAERERQYFMSLLMARDDTALDNLSVQSARSTIAQLTRSNSREIRSFSDGCSPNAAETSTEELEGSTDITKFRDTTGRKSFSKHKFPGDLEDLMVTKATEMGYRESYVKSKLQELRLKVGKDEELTFDRFLYYIRDEGKQMKKTDSTPIPLKKVPSSTSIYSGTPPISPNTLPRDPNVPEIPQYFLCPITHEIMEDPVVASDGYTYEREPMKKWIDIQKTSPMTGAPLINDSLTSNFVLKSMWKDWAEKNLKKDKKK